MLGEGVAALVRFLGLGDGAARLAHITQLPGLQVGGDVEVGLENAQLPHRRLAHAARGEVRDAAVRELDARVGDVDVARQDAEAAGAHLERLGARQRAGEVEVVDHEVEHDIDLGAARLEAGEPLGLDEHRPVHAREQRAEGTVVALDVP